MIIRKSEYIFVQTDNWFHVRKYVNLFFIAFHYLKKRWSFGAS